MQNISRLVLPLLACAESFVSSLKSGGVGQTIGQLQQAASGVAALHAVL